MRCAVEHHDQAPTVIEAARLDGAEGLLVFRAGDRRPLIALRADDARRMNALAGAANMTTANDYGSSAVELETLRRLVEAREVTDVRFGGWTPSGAANGEYLFRLPGGISAWVRSPTGPKGGPRREHPGRWLFRLTHRPRADWQHARTVFDVVDWLIAQADTPGTDR